jgi:hypothetical protein
LTVTEGLRMNERIKELITQAQEIYIYSDAFGQIEGVRFNKEKFAELIINECITLIRKQSIGEERIGGQRYKTVQLGETIATITEHFGVKE